MARFPQWSRELIALYESHATNQFVLHGNVNDRMLVPRPSARGRDGSPGDGASAALGSLDDFLSEVLLQNFEVVLTYDLGNGLRVAKGGSTFSKWPSYTDGHSLPRNPREAIDTITHYLRYCANVRRLSNQHVAVAAVIRAAHLVIPALPGSLNYDLNAMALLVREWASESLLAEHQLATFLVTENLNDLHPLVVNHPRTAHVRVPLPSPESLHDAFQSLAARFPTALTEYQGDLARPARQLAGATLTSIEGLLKRKEHARQPLRDADLADLKKALVEKDCNDLIEFIEPTRTLADVYGQDAIKEWIRQDIALWKADDLEAMPMGYLLCGPVGTGKTFMVECLAGEAAVPVVKLRNFRDKWVGSTEGNLEKIFRLLHALGRCIVFIDEADQALGQRSAGSNDSGVGGRVYSMMAKEMSNSRNRGRILWILASSRPDMIEVDLKRPGRVDVKIPIFPTTTPEEGFHLIRALCRKNRVPLEKDCFEELRPLIPHLITPGAAESLAIKVYRLMKTRQLPAAEALRECLEDYQNPVAEDIMQFQIGLAVKEASDLGFVPEGFRILR